MKNKVVYIHKKGTNGQVFYIGIGNENRPYVKENRSTHWNRTVNKHDIDVCVIKKGLSWEEACDIEVALISFYGRKDKGLGNLVNLTDGGEGAVGGKGRSLDVVDTLTGVEYDSLKAACDSLGFKLTTIAEQLRARRPKKINTLRFTDDLIDDYKPKRKQSKAMPKNSVIDINTNRVYKSIREAAKYFPIAHVSLGFQISGKRKRQTYNTLYLVRDLIIHSDGYIIP
tara:strand:+ start:93 stop:773 length:681 start_codon:yes stop_codon:yes gene_type:complete